MPSVCRSRPVGVKKRRAVAAPPRRTRPLELRLSPVSALGTVPDLAENARFFSGDADVKTLMGDSTVVRAHAGAAGAPAPGQALPVNQALGRSRGGLSTKIHFVVNGIGNPLRAILTPGQAADAPQVPLLFDQFSASIAILDKAYDTDAVLAFFESQGTTPVIPPKANRVVRRDYDRQLYKERNLIERFIGKIKQFRRVFSRFDKYARSYLHFIHFACALIWLR